MGKTKKSRSDRVDDNIAWVLVSYKKYLGLALILVLLGWTIKEGWWSGDTIVSLIQSIKELLS